MLLLTRPDGTPIMTWQEWTRPKKEYQWKPGRSAMELARSWFRNDVLSTPQELLSLLRSVPRLKDLQLTSGIPELVTSLPERGEGRNHDLALKGSTQHESVTVCIEAKVDEPFGAGTTLDYWTQARGKREGGIPTRVPERIEALIAMVDPLNGIIQSPWKNVKYQLLTALCGTILQAKIDGSALAVLVIHEFITNKISSIKRVKNHRDLVTFISVVNSGNDPGIDDTGILYGTFKICGLDCMIGKIITVL